MSGATSSVGLGEQTLAVVFTDVVDSTEILERVGDVAGGALWAQHDQLARSLLRSWRGREIGRSDGFLLLFASCEDAIGFSEAYHAMLAGLSVPLCARVGVHWGQVALRENLASEVSAGATPFEVDGLALPTAARVVSVAQGGQTLVTKSTVENLTATLDARHRVHSHGHWRLKGLEEPLELFEVATSEATFAPPPGSPKAYCVLMRDGLWVPAFSLPQNLGPEPDVFVGREKELRSLARAFEDGAQVVTLLGMGGIGKTRVAQRYARGWLGSYPGGAWFCDLSHARGTDGIAFAVAQALDLPLGRVDPVQQLSAALAARGDCLVILDNFEQVARHAAETLGVWLRNAPAARFLVTSRELLGLAGEQVQVLPALSTEEATSLFERRLISAGAGDAWSPADAGALPKLVEMLDRLPLAIELAAARGRTVAPADQIKRMGERFRLLASRSGRHDRQATLRATLDWSWDLLSEPDRSALAQLSVFEGGFTLDAVEAVVDLSGFSPEPWAGDSLQSLVEKSLVRRVNSRRFELLRTVQDYAAERLGGAAPDALQRHWRFFSQLTEAQATASKCVEIENITAACHRATTAAKTGEIVDAAKCAVGVLGNAWAALRLWGPFRSAIELAGPLVDLQALSACEQAHVQRVLGGAAGLLGDADSAAEHYEKGCALARADGASEFEAQLLCLLGDLRVRHGQFQAAEDALNEASQITKGDSLTMVMLHNARGNHALATSDAPQADEHYGRALQVALRLGDLRWEGGVHGSLGSVAVVRGDLNLARSHLERAVQVADELGDRQWAGNARCNLGLLLFELGQFGDARLALEKALKVATDLGYRRLEAMTLCNLGLVMQATDDLETALMHLRRAVALAHDLRAPKLEGQFHGYLGELLGQLGQPEAAARCFEAADLLLKTSNDGPSLALLDCQRSVAAAHLGNREEAARALRYAEERTTSFSTGAEAELVKALHRARQHLAACSPAEGH
jgi:predicted ATPase/class 3 adenylate cyclase/Tfp pilus assembly protein PilF